MSRYSGRLLLLVAVAALFAAAAFACSSGSKPGTILDEALLANPPRDASTFKAADEDYFRDMDQTKDGPVTLDAGEIQGRNTWLVWTAGDDRLWDVLGVTSVGAVDFLKVVSSHPSQKYSRA